MAAPERLTVGEAAVQLGVKTATVYAYVSRGLLRSHRGAGNGPSHFDAGDVAALVRRRGRRRSAASEAGGDVSAIDAERLLYRGLDACQLARDRSFEQVAWLLWTGEEGGAAAWQADPTLLGLAQAIQAQLPAAVPPVERLAAIIPALAAADPLRLDLTPRAVRLAARSLLATLVDSLPLAQPDCPAGSIAQRLWRRLTPAPEGSLTRVLDAALIALADHGSLPPATATARLAASLRSDPYAVVSAAMGVGSGAQQTRPFLTLQTLFAAIEHPDDHLRVLAERLRLGDDLPGFHPRQYAGSDPRAELLLDLLREAEPASARLTGMLNLVALLQERRGVGPSVEVPVAALAALAGMCSGAGEGIFRVARIAGWLAHALDAYAAPPKVDVPSFLAG